MKIFAVLAFCALSCAAQAPQPTVTPLATWPFLCSSGLPPVLAPVLTPVIGGYMVSIPDAGTQVTAFLFTVTGIRYDNGAQDSITDSVVNSARGGTSSRLIQFAAELVPASITITVQDLGPLAVERQFRPRAK